MKPMRIVAGPAGACLLKLSGRWRRAASLRTMATRSQITSGDTRGATTRRLLNAPIWTGERWVASQLTVSAGDSALGCRQMIGNTWEWTSTAFGAYPGFVAGP